MRFLVSSDRGNWSETVKQPGWASSDGSRISQTGRGCQPQRWERQPIVWQNLYPKRKRKNWNKMVGAALALPLDPLVRITRTLPILGEVSPVFHDFCTHLTVLIVVGVGPHERITKCIVHVVSMHHALNRWEKSLSISLHIRSM